MSSKQLTEAIIRAYQIMVVSWMVGAGQWTAKAKRRGSDGPWLVIANGKSRQAAIDAAVDKFCAFLEWRLEAQAFDGTWHELGSHIDSPTHARQEARHVAQGLEPMTFRLMLIQGDRGAKTATEVDRFEVRKEG